MTRVWWALGIVLLGVASLVCLLPGRELPGAIEFNDKISHTLGHAGLAAYFTGLVPRHNWWKVFVFLLMFGAGIEVAQHFMQVGREADIRDVAANSIGAVLGLLLGHFGLARWPQWAAWLLGRGAMP